MSDRTGGRPRAGGPGQRLRRRLRTGLVHLRTGRRQELWTSLKRMAYTNQEVILFAMDLAADRPAPKLDPRMEIRAGTGADLERFRALPEGGASEFYRDQIDGAEPFVAYWEGEPAHIAWVYDHRLPTRFVRLRPGEAELGYGYTLTAHRGRGLYPLTALVMGQTLARRGYRTVYGHIFRHTFTHGAAYALGLEWAVRRAGFKRIGTVQYLRLLGVQIRPHLAL